MTLDNLTFSLLLGSGSLLAGLLGAMTGLGGGVVLVPLLVLIFGVDMHYAIGASLVSVIATSSGAAAAFVKEGYSNLRVGMFLETATTTGALCGAFVAGWVSPSALGIVFGVVMLYSAWLAHRPRIEDDVTKNRPDALAVRLHFDGAEPTPQGPLSYHVHNVPAGYVLMFIAGALSGLLGIGSGAIKVLAMDQAMHLPFKVSTTTSNFMIGVTAAASAGVYINRGYVDPGLVMPVMLGVLVGSMGGALLLERARPGPLRVIFTVVIVTLGLEMIYNSLSGRI